MSVNLESYFHLSCRTEYGLSQVVLPRRKCSDRTDVQDRIAEVANALASVCVAQASGEVYAVGIRFSPGDHLVIYLAENRAVPLETAAYLKDILAQLRAIAKGQPVAKESPILDEAMTDAHAQKLGKTILKHVFKKFYGSLTKRDTVWDTRIEEILATLSTDSNKPDLRIFEKILSALETIYKMAQYYNEMKSTQHFEQTTSEDWLLRLYSRIHRLDTLIRRSQDKSQVAAVLMRIDQDVPNPYISSESVLENGPDLDLDDNNALRPAFSMTRFLYRIIAISIHMQQLISIALSPRYKAFFKNDAKIQCCPELIKFVNVKPQHVISKLPKTTPIVAEKHTRRKEVWVHAELKIFMALLQETFEGKPPYWVIGVSNLLCVGCHTLIGQAFPWVLREHPHTVLSPFAIPGSHGKIYPWTAPDLSFATGPIGFNMEEVIRHNMKQRMEHTLKEYVMGKPSSNSVVYMEHDVEEAYDCELLGKFEAEMESFKAQNSILSV
ncbi:hypothetical protein CPB83DRAFT_857955 [Crepidotus variabilis]|uniref:Uncharacterized protein n=1 Tax=Crepidotus variabilis TaxID=179855 RepID=A0A9P6EC58_9AGAR|nr:hypothetical protein CPB83DRAFT_857955 [Crepidotus variabilis]